MSASQHFTGKALKVFWVDGSGTADISADRRTLDVTLETGSTEGAAGNDDATYAVPTLKSYSAEYKAASNGTAGTAIRYRLKEGNAGTLMWAEHGTATGQPKWALPALVKSNSIPHPYDDLVEISISFEGQGDLASDGRTAVW